MRQTLVDASSEDGLGCRISRRETLPPSRGGPTDAERTIGPIAQNDLTRMRSYYDRCLLIARRGSLPLLRSMFTETTGWIQETESTVEVRTHSRLAAFRAVVTTLGTITAFIPDRSADRSPSGTARLPVGLASTSPARGSTRIKTISQQPKLPRFIPYSTQPRLGSPTATVSMSRCTGRITRHTSQSLPTPQISNYILLT